MVVKEKTTTPTITQEHITPEVALQYLDLMPVNRRLSQARVDRLTSTMAAGTWNEHLVDPLRFDTNGHLIDGQHRLWALVSSGVSLNFFVARNIPLDGIYLIDTGRARTLADALHINGEVDSYSLAGAVNFYSEWCINGALQKNSAGSTLTPLQGLAIYKDNPGLKAGVTAGNSLRKHLKGGAGRWAAIVYILRTIDNDDADAFITHLTTGEDLHPAHPILQLRKRLLEDAMALRKLYIREYSALVFKTWNLWRKGQTTPRKLAWRAGGKSPEAYPIPE
jgi:hypothetical protein